MGKSLTASGFALLLTMCAASVSAADSRVADAVKQRDSKSLKTLISQRVDVNAPQPDGGTALHWAVYWNDLEAVDLLIRAGANVNASNDLGVTPLFLASEAGQAGAVSRLLAAGASSNVVRETGESPLMAAARSGNLAVVRALLARGADPNARETTHDQTALMWAAANRHAEIVEALVEAGGNLEARSRVRTGRTYLPADRNGSGNTPEEHARFSRYIDEGGYTPLLFAAQHGDAASVKRLLAAGANVNVQAPSGMSALVLAAHNDHTEAVDALIAGGADVESSAAGYTALHAAVLRGNVDIVSALLEHRANPNATISQATGARRYSQDWSFGDDLVGATPYYLAARFAEIPIMKVLAARGANTRFAMPDGSTAVMAAMDTALTRSGELEGFGTDRRGRYVFARLLTVQSPEEAQKDVLEIVKLAVASGADVNAAVLTGDTAMHKAVAKGLPSVIEFLAASGANVNAVNKKGQTPLAVAQATRRRLGGDVVATNKAVTDLLQSLGGHQ